MRHCCPRTASLFRNRCYSVMQKHSEDKVDLNVIKEAAERIKNFVQKTPVLTSEFMNQLSGRNLYFKCENFQKTGSFKYRGATNAVLRVKELHQQDDFVTVTHSSGNMGQALSLASTKHGVKSVIVVPDNAPIVKKKSIVGYGAEMVECESTPQARAEMCNAVLEKLGSQGEFVPSSDHPFIMEGQGTIAVEMLAEIPHLDAIVVCCGIGGLVSGIAVAAKTLKPSIKIYGAEPSLANDVEKSFQRGSRVSFTELPNTIADGLRMSVGEYTWPLIQTHVDGIVVASDKQIISAMYLVWERMKIVVEPSGVMALAAVLTERFRQFPDGLKHIGVVISGGNMDLDKIPWMDKEKADQ